jgi:threonine/homoserine/homoserine lactone efflux protein
MSIHDLLMLIVIMLLLAALPSSSVALVVVRSATLGVKHGIATSLGIVAGDLIFVLLAIFGLSALSQTMGALFGIFRYVAAGYLIWFGWELISSSFEQATDKADKPITGHITNSFIAGLALTLGDIKAIFFYASLFPTFVDVSSPDMLQISQIILVTCLAVGSVKLAYAVTAKAVVRYAQKFTFRKPAQITAGSAMIGLGGYLLVKS